MAFPPRPFFACSRGYGGGGGGGYGQRRGGGFGGGNWEREREQDPFAEAEHEREAVSLAGSSSAWVVLDGFGGAAGGGVGPRSNFCA